MPVSYGVYKKQLKLLPLTLYPDGRASVSVRFGYVGEDEVFNAISEQAFQIDETGVSAILDSQPIHGLSRRDDLAYSVYAYLVQNGLIEPGTVS